MNHPLLQRVHNVYTTYPKVLTAIPISRLAANSCPYRVPAAVAIPTVVNSHPKLRSEAIVEMPGSPTVSEHLREKGTQAQGGRPLDKGTSCSGKDFYRSLRKVTIKFTPHSRAQGGIP